MYSGHIYLLYNYTMWNDGSIEHYVSKDLGTYNSSVVWIGGSGEMSECPQISCYHAIHPRFQAAISSQKVECLLKHQTYWSKVYGFHFFFRFQYLFSLWKIRGYFFWYQSCQPWPLLKATAAVDCNSLRPGGEERENISHQNGKAGNYSNIPWVGIILVSRR